MTNSTHTAGPWTFSKEAGFCSQIDGADGSVVCCFDQDPKPADARLMECAPELHEALKIAYRHMNGGSDTLTPMEFHEGFLKVRAVLDKIAEVSK